MAKRLGLNYRTCTACEKTYLAIGKMAKCFECLDRNALNYWLDADRAIISLAENNSSSREGWTVEQLQEKAKKLF